MVEIELTKECFRHLLADIRVIIRDQYEIGFEPMTQTEKLDAVLDAIGLVMPDRNPEIIAAKQHAVLLAELDALSKEAVKLSHENRTLREVVILCNQIAIAHEDVTPKTCRDSADLDLRDQYGQVQKLDPLPRESKSS